MCTVVYVCVCTFVSVNVYAWSLLQVVTLDLTVVKVLATSQAYTGNDGNKLTPYFRQFLVQLLQLFQSNRRLLEARGSFIIRFICSSCHNYMLLPLIKL